MACCTTKEHKAAYPPKLNNALFGRAWTLCHKKKELSVTRLVELIVSGDDGPELAVKKILRVVRKSVEKVAPLQKPSWTSSREDNENQENPLATTFSDEPTLMNDL